MKPIITQGDTIDNSGAIQPDSLSLPDQTMTDPGIGLARPPIAASSHVTSSVPLSPAPAMSGGEADQPIHTMTSSAEIAPAQVPAAGAQSGLVINVSFDSSVTSLQSSNMTLFNEYTNAVQAAAQFFESEFTNPITVNIAFGWGEVGGNLIDPGASGESSSSLSSFTYTDLLAAVKNTDTTSAVQTTAVATLPQSDITSSGTFGVNTAEQKALGLMGPSTSLDGSVGLDSSSMTDFAWTRDNIQSGQEDAIGTLEHEISEVLGRSADAGKGNNFTLLDMFRYTAADGGTDDAPGSAAGGRDEPFVAGFNVNASSYFSFDGTHVTLPFETPADVAPPSLSDVADWDPTVAGDAFADGPVGQADNVSPTDVQLMNVLGYDVLPCFAAGTHILTTTGPRLVETLAPGDEVRTLLGESGRIVWIGHRTLDCSRHSRPEKIWPIRVSAGAFGPAMPERDLFMSPDHAVYIDGVLIPAKLLANGMTIHQVARRSITYYHVELARHDVVLAEGLPAETYLDTGNKTAFENSGLPPRLHPDFAGDQTQRETRSCAPLITEPAQTEPVWRALASRATALGWVLPEPPALGDEPDLHLLAGTRRIKPVLVKDGRYSFVLPSGDAPARLVSRSACPRDERPWMGDDRRLGVKISRLTMRSDQNVRDVAIDDPALDEGWWQVERDAGVSCRWTTGDALLPTLGAGVLEVELADTMRYPADGDLSALRGTLTAGLTERAAA
jgi:hypothetical protein